MPSEVVRYEVVPFASDEVCKWCCLQVLLSASAGRRQVVRLVSNLPFLAGAMSWSPIDEILTEGHLSPPTLGFNNIYVHLTSLRLLVLKLDCSGGGLF